MYVCLWSDFNLTSVSCTQTLDVNNIEYYLDLIWRNDNISFWNMPSNSIYCIWSKAIMCQYQWKKKLIDKEWIRNLHGVSTACWIARKIVMTCSLFIIIGFEIDEWIGVKSKQTWWAISCIFCQGRVFLINKFLWRISPLKKLRNEICEK